MLDFSFPRRLAESGFEHRATPAPDGRIVYRLADKSGHVRVDPAEWDRLLAEFSTRVRDIQRGTRKWSIWLFPGIFLFGMTAPEVAARKARGYRPRDVYEANAELRETLDLIGSGLFASADHLFVTQ